MIHVTIDDRLDDAPRRVATATAHDLAARPALAIECSVFLGAGSASLVTPSDPRPHVVVPLIGTRRLDAITKAQIAAADALVAMDHREEAAMRAAGASTALIITVAAVAPQQERVIHTENPLDAVEVEAFLAEAPEVAASLRVLHVPLEPFRPAAITEAIIEAIFASSGATDLDSIR